MSHAAIPLPCPDFGPAAQPALPAVTGAASGTARRAADEARRPGPAAVVVVPLPPGPPGALRAILASVAASRGVLGLPATPGALAVLILAAGPEAATVVEAVAPDYPFPLRVETGPADAVLAIRRAGAWAAALGVAGVPVLLVPGGRPVPPRWAHDLLDALLDGADLVTTRTGACRRLLFGAGLPQALSARAQRAMERWSAGRGAAWTGAGSPWRRPARSGLRAVSA